MMSLLYTHTPVKLPLYYIIYISLHPWPIIDTLHFCRSWSIKNMVFIMAPCIATDHPKKLPHSPRHKGQKLHDSIAPQRSGLPVCKSLPWVRWFSHKKWWFSMVFHSYVNVYQRVEGTAMSFEPHHQLPSPQIPAAMTSGEGQTWIPPLRSSRMPSSNFCWSPPSAWVRMSGGSGMGYIWC